MLPSINKTQNEIKICVSLCFKEKRKESEREEEEMAVECSREKEADCVCVCVARKCGDETCLRVKRISKWKENVHAVRTFAVHSLQQKPQDRKQEIANRKNEPHYKMQT